MNERRLFYLVVCIALAGQIMFAAYFLPQKWKACQKLYDSRLAQIMCFTSN
jgi:hypothetical protein